MLRIRLLVPVVAGVLVSLVARPSKAAGWPETFSSDPATRGWHAWGQTNLFHWNAANQNLEVTWDSSKSNSYFCRPLGATFTKADSFTLAFDLRLSDFVAGINPDMPNPFQLSIGLINFSGATQPGFARGSGYQSPDLVEFSFFPDPGPPWLWGPSVTAMLADSSGFNWSSGGFGPFALSENDVLHVSMTYVAGQRTMHTVVTHAGQPVGTVSNSKLGTAFTDFSVDHVAVCSYNELGQWAGYEGSILAHGTVDNLSVILWPPMKTTVSNGVWRAHCESNTNFLYTLERTVDFQGWTNLVTNLPGTGQPLALQDTNAPAGHAFYRLRAEQP